jgi:hypothetical protein
MAASHGDKPLMRSEIEGIPGHSSVTHHERSSASTESVGKEASSSEILNTYLAGIRRSRKRKRYRCLSGDLHRITTMTAG